MSNTTLWCTACGASTALVEKTTHERNCRAGPVTWTSVNPHKPWVSASSPAPPARPDIANSILANVSHMANSAWLTNQPRCQVAMAPAAPTATATPTSAAPTCATSCAAGEQSGEQLPQHERPSRMAAAIVSISVLRRVVSGGDGMTREEGTIYDNNSAVLTGVFLQQTEAKAIRLCPLASAVGGMMRRPAALAEPSLQLL
jgi:hypothetical protein